MKVDINVLRAINETQIQTLEKQGDSVDLFYAQVVGQILEDEHCFAVMQIAEIEKLLLMLGFNADFAHQQALDLKTR